MSDPLEETISLSDMTEITETEDPRATQYGSTSVTHRRIGDIGSPSRVVVGSFVSRVWVGPVGGELS